MTIIQEADYENKTQITKKQNSNPISHTNTTIENHNNSGSSVMDKLNNFITNYCGNCFYDVEKQERKKIQQKSSA